MTIVLRLLLAAGLGICVAVAAGCAPQVMGDDDLGEQPCAPGASMCVDTGSAVCRADGSGYDVEYCDPLQGSTCDVDRGSCSGPCQPGLPLLGT